MSVPSDVLSQQVTSMSSVVFLVLLLCAALGILALRESRLVRPVMLGSLAVFATAFDLMSQGAYVEIEPNDPLVGYRHEGALAFLDTDPGVYRVETTSEIHGSWAPDWALLYKEDDLNGIWNPLRLGAYDVLTWVGIGRADPFYRLYNTRYLITSKDTAVPPQFELAFDEGTVAIYRNAEALPRAFMLYEVVLADGDISALSAVRSPSFDPARQIVLKRDSHPALLESRFAEGEREVRITDRGPNHLDFEVITPAEGYLFVSEMWMPGWIAYVDGSKGKVLQANYTFRAVYIPEGRHQVHMVYRPTAWLVGLGTSLATLAALALWAGWSRYRSCSLWRIANRSP